MFGDQPWIWECPGKPRAGATRGESEGKLHVWKRQPDRTAICKKCGLTLTVEQADDCFRQW
jgi:hypothetical protein